MMAESSSMTTRDNDSTTAVRTASAVDGSEQNLIPPSRRRQGGRRPSSSASSFAAGGSAALTTTTTTTAKLSRQRGAIQKLRALPHLAQLMASPPFVALMAFLVIALGISFWLAFMVNQDGEVLLPVGGNAISSSSSSGIRGAGKVPALLDDGPHLTPRLPHLPVFAPIANGDALAAQTLLGVHATLAGVAHILNQFTTALHDNNLQLSERKAELSEIIASYFQLAQTHLHPLEDAYRGRPLFPVRSDDSIYMSLAAFREHLLCQTLQSAFDQAQHPEKLFIGAIVQNCFGLDDRVCRTGLQVVGKNAQGRDQVKQSDAPPDVNGIEAFCALPNYTQYCERGQIRALYIHDTDALGPAIARYYASKLWGGETYFLQMDSHLIFAPQWDAKYIAEVEAAKSYPKAVLSAYPPGFQNFGAYTGGTPGSRLCTCVFSPNEVESHILRINVGGRPSLPDAPRPTQIPFIAAGFFFAHASFLTDVPFDPYVPWCFMGEEIALSIRAWTAGWDIYAPRTNLIAHQYRPGRLGLPKFWESVGRDSGRPNLNTRLQSHVIRRIKHLVGYPTDTLEELVKDGDDLVLMDLAEHYGIGKERTLEEYLKWTGINVEQQTCQAMEWCNTGALE